MQQANDPVIAMLERGFETFKDRRVLIAGEIADTALLQICAQAALVTVLTDSYAFARECACLLDQDFSLEHPVTGGRKLKVIFAAPETALPLIDEGQDDLLLLLSKSRELNLKLLSLLQTRLKLNESRIFTAGANSGGGKSAAALLKPLAAVKADSARKCTLFAADYTARLPEVRELQPVGLDFKGQHLELLQEAGIFAAGRIDRGSMLLLQALAELDFTALNLKVHSALDLGCGCGVLGLALACACPELKELTLLDDSAAALSLAGRNCLKHGLNPALLRLCADTAELPASGCDLIISNPPYHQGLRQ